jgi:hypothetical protein
MRQAIHFEQLDKVGRLLVVQINIVADHLSDLLALLQRSRPNLRCARAN